MTRKKRKDVSFVRLMYRKRMAVVPVSEVIRYEQFKGRELKTFNVDDLKRSDVLKHWCHERYDMGNGKYAFVRFSIETLYEHLKRLENVDMSQPILICGGKVADGMHRILKAVSTGVKTLDGYVIPDEDIKELINLYDED